MPTVTCPKCNRSYDIDAATVGMECECHCGHTFTAQVKPEASIVIPAKPKPSSAAASKPTPARPVVNGTVSTLRTLGYICIFCGFLLILFGLLEEYVIWIFIGGSTVISSVFYFAVALIIDTLLKIQENTQLLVEKFNDKARQD